MNETRTVAQLLSAEMVCHALLLRRRGLFFATTVYAEEDAEEVADADAGDEEEEEEKVRLSRRGRAGSSCRDSLPSTICAPQRNVR